MKGNCYLEWVRVKNNGVKEILSSDGKFWSILYLSVQIPFRRLKNPLQIIHYDPWTEFLDLSLDDVGESIELIYTPVREDGIEGSPRSIRTDGIAPGELSFQIWKNVNLVLSFCRMSI